MATSASSVALLCCTSDFDGNELLNFVDIRIYRLWDAFVDKGADVDDQLDQIESLYTFAYPTDPSVTPVAIPELDCADYNADGDLSFVDVRFYRLWDAFVDQGASLGDQLSQMDSLWVFAYPTDPVETACRIPALLDPAECVGLKGWFITPWHDELALQGGNFGWLE
jgi:hypothetical protein